MQRQDSGQEGQVRQREAADIESTRQKKKKKRERERERERPTDTESYTDIHRQK